MRGRNEKKRRCRRNVIKYFILELFFACFFPSFRLCCSFRKILRKNVLIPTRTCVWDDLLASPSNHQRNSAVCVAPLKCIRHVDWQQMLECMSTIDRQRTNSTSKKERPLWRLIVLFDGKSSRDFKAQHWRELPPGMQPIQTSTVDKIKFSRRKKFSNQFSMGRSCHWGSLFGASTKRPEAIHCTMRCVFWRDKPLSNIVIVWEEFQRTQRTLVRLVDSMDHTAGERFSFQQFDKHGQFN